MMEASSRDPLLIPLRERGLGHDADNATTPPDHRPAAHAPGECVLTWIDVTSPR